MIFNTRILSFVNQEIVKRAEVGEKVSHEGEMEEMEGGHNLLKFQLVMWAKPDQLQLGTVLDLVACASIPPGSQIFPDSPGWIPGGYSSQNPLIAVF